MIDYNGWKRIKLSPTNIKLDDENLRLSGFDAKPNEREIIDYLVSNEKVYNLAKNISQKGYFPNEEPIVYKEGKRFVVVEGNRRVTACKLLISPNAAPKPKIKSFEKLSKDFDRELIRKLYCRVAPTREDADVLIENRHTNTEIEKWDRIKQYRYYYVRFESGKSIDELASRFNRTPGEVIKFIRRYEMFKLAKELPLDNMILAVLEDEPKLDATNLERFYETKEGKEFLALGFTENHKPKFSLPESEMIARYSRVVEEFANKGLNSRNYGNGTQEKQEYIDYLFSNYENLNKEITPSEEFYEYEPEEADETSQNDGQDQSDEEKRPKSKPSSAKLIPSSWSCNTDIERINKICSELQQLPLGSKANSAYILFRSFLEMVTYQYLLLNNEIDSVKVEAGQEIDKQFDKRYRNIVGYMYREHDIEEESIKKRSLTKALSKKSLPNDWTPSLYHMLAHLAKNDVGLISNAKIKEALKQYLRLKGGSLTHNDFNMFVHNEYSITPSPKEINDQWTPIRPLLKLMIEQLDINNQQQQ